MDLAPTNHLTQVGDRCLPKLTLGEINSQVGLGEAVKQLSDLNQMFWPGGTKHYHIIEICVAPPSILIGHD